MLTKILSFDDQLDRESSYQDYITGEMLNSERRSRMEKLLKKAIQHELTERQKDCITYYYYRGMKVADISELMSIRPTTVYKHLKAGRKALKKCAVYF